MYLKVEKLYKKYGEKEVVKSISFDIPKGVILGLLGPNGSGKTTAIKMLTGQLQSDKGGIYYNGENINDLKSRINEYIGVMPQEIVLVEHLNIEENLFFSGIMYNLPDRYLKERVEYLIKSLHLEKERKTRAKHLSGGYRRRLNLAISIIHDPKVIFLDEPTVAVDPQSRNNILEGIRKLNKN